MYLLKWPVIIHSLISLSLAALVNVTVDDTYGDPETGNNITYLPPDQWNDGPTCGWCPSQDDLDRTMILNGTWHDGTALAGNYSQKRTKDITSQYNFLIYANQTLPQGDHILTIQNGHVNGATSPLLLDYIVYSYDNSLGAPMKSPIRSASAASRTSTSDSPAISAENSQSLEVTSAGKIVGAVLGSIGGVLLVLVAILWHRQRTWKRPSDLPCPPTTSPKPTSINPVTRIQNWWRNPGSGSRSRFSFDPSLLVESMMNHQKHATTLNFRRPPPVTTIHPIYPLPQRPDSTHSLQPNREVILTPTPSLDLRNEPNHPLSIIEWQRRTQREADDVAPRFDVSDVEMSSYYEFSSDTPDPLPLQPPPRSAPRRFTVVNN
ncbi:hypothetical protein C0995_008555 [Termitomyces sp. Mi166|nr:hypothetical protein C0995_008555 [Termitomyces sp. Mi166\